VNRATTVRFVAQERRVVAALAAVYSTRMLGMFMLLPVLALFASDMRGATPLLAGLAMGAYGFTQALLQIPFGRWSDRLGRKPVIVAGLLIYLAGSVVGALASTIHAVIAARAIQGAGAVSGPVTALLADLTRPEIRTRAMAFIGISIGACFILSLVAGPLLSVVLGLGGFFWLMAVMAIAGIVVLLLAVPTPAAARPEGPFVWRDAFSTGLVVQYVGVFTLHFILVATFIAVPHALRKVHGLATGQHWQVYLLVFLVSVAGTVPLVLAAERRRHAAGGILRLGIALLVLGQLVMALDLASIRALYLGLIIYFAAFNFLEARLPARVSELAPGHRRGVALGVFATSQFLGAFAGGAVGGALMGTDGGIAAVFGAAGFAAALWWLVDRTASRYAGGQRESAVSRL
jgi:MFS family permease